MTLFQYALIRPSIVTALRPFFNGLQARTEHTLSPETRQFAEFCYESKLAHYVSVALVKCATSAGGRVKAEEIANEMRGESKKNLKMTWKPLVDQCADLLRKLKMESTNAKLARLSDHWGKKKEGEKLSRMLMTIVKKAMTSGNPPLWRAYLELMQWTELSSIDNFPITQIIDESLARDMSTVPMRKIVVVKRNEAMHCAELFVENEWKKNCPIHVITDSEEDAARFYKRACVLWPQINTQLNWRGKKFGWVKSEPWIAIGTRKYFTSTRDQIGDRSKVAAVFVHAESVIDDLSPQCVEFEKDNIDEFLVHLFVMASVTVKRVREIERANLKSTEMLADLMKTWPTVYQVLKEDEIRKILEESFIPSELSMNEPPLLSEKLRMYARHAVRMTMDKSMIPTQLQKHVENNAAAYVNSAFHALEAMILGEDYIVYLERSNEKWIGGDYNDRSVSFAALLLKPGTNNTGQ